MVATSGMNVGIGTSSPSYKFDVFGSGSFDGLNINDEYNFPTTDGSANQILKTDGSGNLSWQDETVIKQTVNGRLSLVSGNPITTANQTAKTTIYFVPYDGDQISIYDGSNWVLYSFSELSLSLSGFTADTNYDIFVYDNSGALTLEGVAWTNDTTRATAITKQDDVYVKSGDTAKRYLGTIRTTSTAGQCEDSDTRRFVWNYYNRKIRNLYCVASTGGHTYTSTTSRPFNDSTTVASTRVLFVCGTADTLVQIGHRSQCKYGYQGVDIDSETTNVAGLKNCISDGTNTNFGIMAGNSEYRYVNVGYHYIQSLERGITAGSTFYNTAIVSSVEG